MANSTFIAGMRGTGKSTLLTTYGSSAIGIEAEAIQAEAIRIAKGGNHPRPYSWDAWDHSLIQNATTFLRPAFDSVYPGLANSKKPILIVGSILVLDWFRNSLSEVLRQDFADQFFDIRPYILHYEPRIISDWITARGRTHESAFFNNIELITQKRNDYLRLASKDWEKITSSDELHRILKNRIFCGSKPI